MVEEGKLSLQQNNFLPLPQAKSLEVVERRVTEEWWRDQDILPMGGERGLEKKTAPTSRTGVWKGAGSADPKGTHPSLMA